MQIKKETIVGTFVLASISAFLYMGYKIGFFNIDQASYVSYYVNFSNASGLTKKADIRIAGVKVGWVDSFNLSSANNCCDVVTKIMVLGKYKLGLDTQAYIKQDGIFSIKFIELIPGKQSDIILKEGDFLNKELSAVQPTIEDLVLSVNKVLKETLQVTNSLKSIFVDKDIIYAVKDSLESASLTTKIFNNFIAKNQEKVETIIKNLHKLSIITPNIIESADKFIDKISNGSDIIMDTLTKEPCPIDNNSKLPSSSSKEPFISDVIETVVGAKSVIKNFSNISLGIDNNYQCFSDINNHNNFESVLNFWIHPNDYLYFLTGVTFSKDGFVKQKKIDLIRNPRETFMLNTTPNGDNIAYEVFKRKTNSFLFNMQIGGYFFNNFGARVGFFRSTPGFALDCYLPIFKDKLKLISTLEVSDFTGKNHFVKDNKPQVRFLNKLFFTPNFYISFGAKDFTNSKNIGGFIGLGFDLGDTFFRS